MPTPLSCSSKKRVRSVKSRGDDDNEMVEYVIGDCNDCPGGWDGAPLHFTKESHTAITHTIPICFHVDLNAGCRRGVIN